VAALEVLCDSPTVVLRVVCAGEPLSRSGYIIGNVVRSLLALLISAVFTLPGLAQPSGIPASSVSAIAIDPRNPATVFAGTTDGIYKSTTGGATWVSVRPNAKVFSMAIDPANAALYVVAAVDSGFPDKTDGILKTTDGGATWMSIGLLDVNVVAVDAASTVYVGTTAGWGEFGGAFKSPDGGRTWISLTKSRLLCAGIVHPMCHYEHDGFGAWGIDTRTSSVYAAGGPHQGRAPSVLIVDPADPSTGYATNPWRVSVGIRKSSDGGQTWIGSGALPICCGVFKSVNGDGGLWLAVSTGLPGQQNATALAIDPVTTATLYAGFPDGVFKTVNGGGNWNLASNGLPCGIAINAIAVDPRTPATVYAGTSLGMYRSINGGTSWTAMNTGLKPVPPVTDPASWTRSENRICCGATHRTVRLRCGS
jgi:photosystem II stability/assembly factor-like uncharacterized protein